MLHAFTIPTTICIYTMLFNLIPVSQIESNQTISKGGGQFSILTMDHALRHVSMHYCTSIL